MDLSLVKIESDRLVLKPVSQSYTDDIFLAYRDPITKYMNHGPPENI